ncbi:RNA polymerase sigma factor [Microbacterium sp. NPDC089698]|uniref:RNA polymerase sigma factor n=1 Tax=Microbacterium sp. NPDC089698 TaxID=3364200 RepID=UPI003815B0FA
MTEVRSDAELLRDVRAGDRGAYDALWRRHYGAGIRYAGRLAPTRAEDLVSESFLAIYQQVTTTPNGPTFAFRSYLKAVIRNTSIRWHKDAERLLDSDDVDDVEHRDALSYAEQESESADVLAAFQELPDRWQRVLWLAEVADASRSDIARELQIRPNAVSALQRRARSGLKFQWLSRQIPVALREETAHVARLLPQYLTEPRNAMLAAEVGAHTSDCADCRELLGSLRGGAARLQGTTLAVLLGSAGLSVPAAASMTTGTAAAAAAVSAAGIGASGWFLVGGGLIVAGSLALAPLVIVAPALPDPGPTSAPAAITAPLPALPLLAVPPLTSAVDEVVDTTPIPIGTIELGRLVSDPSIPVIDLSTDPVSRYLPPQPLPAGPDTPGPGSGTGGTPGLDPGVTTPADVTAYVAPMITGQTAPGNSVAIDFASQRYPVDVAPDGSWTFDTRPLAFDIGTYDYSVWAFTPTEQSLATTGTVTVQAPTVQGFEQLSGPIPLEEARTTGLVISITGPANGTVWVSTTKTDATVTLDSTGHAIRRIRMLADGWYPFGFAVIDADWYSGPAFAADVDVLDASRGPNWPRGGGGVFEIVDP